MDNTREPGQALLVEQMFSAYQSAKARLVNDLKTEDKLSEAAKNAPLIFEPYYSRNPVRKAIKKTLGKVMWYLLGRQVGFNKAVVELLSQQEHRNRDEAERFLESLRLVAQLEKRVEDLSAQVDVLCASGAPTPPTSNA